MPDSNYENEGASAQLVRLSERARALDERLTDRMKMLDDKINDIKEIVEKLDSNLDKYETGVEEKFVSKLEYEPIRKLVYGAVGFILITVLSTFMLLIVRSGAEKIPMLPPSVTVTK